MDVIRCNHCRFSEMTDCGLVCKVRAGVGMFFVPDDGFCHMAEDRSDCGTCAECKYYREHSHDYLGDRFDGVCCMSELIAFSTMSSEKACRGFGKR